ncbi:MAG: 4Fe-4S cluster-binding domain-containing protein [Spirochaetota bacterium]|nr:4Fe-4S cluster-binding domain-containing protein [Spirochaetota bacterium]
MKFPWFKYEELPLSSRPTAQIFVTTRCNLRCDGCFARNVMKDSKQKDMSMDMYKSVVADAFQKGVQQINILGGEPLLHKDLRRMIAINNLLDLKTTIYTNGYILDQYDQKDFGGVKLRLSIYSHKGHVKAVTKIPQGLHFDANYMVSANTILSDLHLAAKYCEEVYGCKVFFISSIRELDNLRREFFDDTDLTMSVLKYKELVHEFLYKYTGNMDIHVSKRGVFESTRSLPNKTCNFVNIFPNGKIIQCPYDVVNLKYQNHYEFGKRYCQQNNTCLMSKVIYRRRR